MSALLAAAERAKIVLTAHEEHQALFDFIEDDFVVNIGRAQFEISIQEEVRKISAAATRCLHDAQVKPEEIDLVILTGGSTEVPVVQAEFKRLFPHAAIAMHAQNGQRFATIGSALKAGMAVPAMEVRRHRTAIPGLQVCNIRSHSQHFDPQFMAEDAREFDEGHLA